MNIVLSSIGALKNPRESARITLFLLAKELRRRGQEVRIIAKGNGEEKETEEIDSFPVYKTTIIKIPFLLQALHKEKKIDIIHSFSASPLFALPHFFAPGKKVHTLKSYSRTKMGRIGYHLLRLADAVTVPTQIFASSLPVKKKMHIIHSPVNSEKFSPQDQEKLKKKHRLENNLIVFYYGALWDNKGVDILLKAIPLVAQQKPSLKLVLAPRYQQIQEQQALIQELNIEKEVQWVFGDASIEEYVNLADVVVLPYKNLNGTEGNPSCLLEAMACKTPVVTTDLPELREIAGGCVLFTEPANPQALAENILKSLDLPTEEKRKMLEEAFIRAQPFNYHHIAQEFLQLYSSLVQGQVYK